MQGKRFLGALMLSTAFVAMSLPAQAAAPEEQLYVWLRSDGAWGLAPLSDLPSADVNQDCYGIAPLETTCTLSASKTTNWLVGWAAPSTAAVNAGALLASTDLNMVSSSNGARVVGHCNWRALGVNGFLIPPVGGVACTFQFIGGVPLGDITANFSTGSHDGMPVPGAGVGTWHALLYSTP